MIEKSIQIVPKKIDSNCIKKVRFNKKTKVSIYFIDGKFKSSTKSNEKSKKPVPREQITIAYFKSLLECEKFDTREVEKMIGNYLDFLDELKKKLKK